MNVSGRQIFRLLLLLCCVPLVVHSVEVGDSKEDVLRELGKPTAFSDLGGKALMMYPRGKVVLVDGRVSSTTVMSQDEYEKQQVAAIALRKKRAGALAAERKARREEGGRMLGQLATNKVFLASSPIRQVEILESFQQRYPEINADVLLVPARHAARNEIRAQGERLADSMRRDPAYLKKSWSDRVQILQEFTRRYPGVDVEDLKAVVIADRNRAMEEHRQRQEMARLRQDAALSEARRLEEMRRREAAEQALARAERENAYHRYQPYPVYVPVPVSPVIQARPAQPAAPTVYKRESFLERSRREAEKITGSKR